MDSLDAKPPSSPPEPPRGLGSLLFLVLLWLLPGGVACVLRAALGLPLWVGGVAGAAGVAGVTWRVVSRERPWPTHAPLALLQGLHLALIAGLTWRMLGIPVMAGLVTVGGGDAGNHVVLRSDFVTQAPGTYQGFTLFHTVTYGLEWLFGLDAFTSFRAGFYLVPAVFTVALAAGLECVAGRLWRSGRALVAAQAGLLVATAGVWAFLLFRWLHYNQADGFYAHLFGLVPLVLAWVAYGLPRSAWSRCAALAAFVVFYRFTYGLNLADFLVTCGVLVAVEGHRALGPRYRWAAWGVGLGLLGAAAYAYWRLLPLAPITGGLVVHSYQRALRVQCWTLAGLLVVRFFSPREESVERRLLDFAVLFGGVNALVQLAYLGSGLPTEYYFVKYGFHAIVLLLCAFVLAASIRVGALFQTGLPHARRWDVALAVLVAIGLVEVTRGWGRAYGAYAASYWERVRGEPPFQAIEPLEDRGSTELIRQVLREKGKHFGSLVSPSWPRVAFSNPSLGWVPEGPDAINRHWPLFSEGKLRQGPGLCVFWESSPEDWVHYKDLYPPLVEAVRALQARPDKECRDYAAPWVTGGSRTLCYHCD